MRDGECEVLINAVSTYGKCSQIHMMIEEMAELTNALLKTMRVDGRPNLWDDEDVREEMADVSIMLDQMQIIYGDISEIRAGKIRRLKRRLEHPPERGCPFEETPGGDTDDTI